MSFFYQNLGITVYTLENYSNFKIRFTFNNGSGKISPLQETPSLLKMWTDEENQGQKAQKAQRAQNPW